MLCGLFVPEMEVLVMLRIVQGLLACVVLLIGLSGRAMLVPGSGAAAGMPHVCAVPIALARAPSAGIALPVGVS